jgi:hypothetical protein
MKLAACVAAALLAVAHPLASVAAQPDDVLSVVGVVGTSLKLATANGATVDGLQLAGRTVVVGQSGAEQRFRIVGVQRDPRQPDLLLHEVEALGADGAWRNACLPDADGQRLLVFIAGYFTPGGEHVPDPKRVSVSCTMGVQAKCLRNGYRYWDDRRGAGTGEPLYQACTRMFRADYGGDGDGWTRNGTPIDLYDVYGIQHPEPASDLEFEAAWGPGGALCVNHTRVADRINLATLLQRYPRLAAMPSGEQCTEEWARRQPGVVLFNKSAR